MRKSTICIFMNFVINEKKENSSEKERYPIVAKPHKVLKCLQKTKQLYD